MKIEAKQTLHIKIIKIFDYISLSLGAVMCEFLLLIPIHLIAPLNSPKVNGFSHCKTHKASYIFGFITL